MSLIRDGVSDVRRTARGWRWGRRSQVPRSAEPYVLPAKQTVFPSDWSRKRPAMAVREVVQKAGLEPLFRSQVRTKVEGLDVLDRIEGPVIFAANHASHLDTPLILLSLPDEWRRRTGVAAAADYFFDTWWRAVGSSLFFNTFPIDRRGGSMATTPGEVLADGWSLVIFPEGTRSKDGWIGTFRMGAAFLAHEHGVPVVPVAHRGTFAAMPRGQGWPSPGRRQLTIRFGEPLRPREGESVREFAPRIKAAVATLLDEDKTTWWEARRRAAAGDTPDPSGSARRPVAPGLGAVGVALGRRAGSPAAGLGPRASVRALSPLAHALPHAGRARSPHDKDSRRPGRPDHHRAARSRRARLRLRIGCAEVTTTGSSRPAAAPTAPTGSSRSRPTTAASRSRARSTATSPARAGAGRSRTTAPSRRRARPPPAAAAARSASSARSPTRPAPTTSSSRRSAPARSAPAPSLSDLGRGPSDPRGLRDRTRRASSLPGPTSRRGPVLGRDRAGLEVLAAEQVRPLPEGCRPGPTSTATARRL